METPQPETNTAPTPDKRLPNDIKLSSDQFTVNEKGELIDKTDDLVLAIQHAQAAAATPELGVLGGIALIV